MFYLPQNDIVIYGLGLWYLTPLATIFQLYSGG